MSTTSHKRCCRTSQIQMDLFLLGCRPGNGPSDREACVAGVESYSGPQGTLASPESLRSVPWHSRHSLEPLGTTY